MNPRPRLTPRFYRLKTPPCPPRQDRVARPTPSTKPARGRTEQTPSGRSDFSADQSEPMPMAGDPDGPVVWPDTEQVDATLGPAIVAEVIYSVRPGGDGGIEIRWQDEPEQFYAAERLWDGSIRLEAVGRRKMVGLTDKHGRLFLKGAEDVAGYHVHHDADGSTRLVPRRGAMMAPGVALVRYYDGRQVRTEQVSAHAASSARLGRSP